MTALIDALAEHADTGSAAAGALTRQLQAAARRSPCAVIFDPQLPPLDLSATHIVFATHQMALPKRHELTSDLHAAKLPFAALLGLLSAILVGRQRNRRLAARYVAALGVTDPDVRDRLLRTITDGLSPLSHVDPATGDNVVQPGREGEFLAKIHHRIGRIKVL